MDLSICIVNWNSSELLQQCLASIEATRGDLALQVIVVDNASSDDSVEMVREGFPWVELIANTENRFYAAGNNQALGASTAPLRLLLNPDIEVHPHALEALVDWMCEHPEAAGVAPRLVYPDGRLQHSCRSAPGPDIVLYEALGLSRLFPASPVLGKYRMTWWQYDEERPVHQPMASALMLRAEVLEQVGLFDESFPMFFNDVDLCQRIREAGWQIWFTPAAIMTHYHGGSTRRVRREMIAESGRSFVRYYHKHYRGNISWLSYGLAVCLLRAAYAMRLLWASVRRDETPSTESER